MYILKKDVNEMRQKLKQKGYNLKTRYFTDIKSFFDDYKNNKWIYGSSGSVYNKDDFIKYKTAIDIIRDYKK